MGRTRFEHAEPILSVADLEMHVDDLDGHVLRFGSEPVRPG